MLTPKAAQSGEEPVALPHRSPQCPRTTTDGPRPTCRSARLEGFPVYGQDSDSATQLALGWRGASLPVGRVLAVALALSFSMGVVGVSTAQTATPRPMPLALSSWQPTHGHDNGIATPCDRANNGGCANNGRNGGYDDDDG